MKEEEKSRRADNEGEARGWVTRKLAARPDHSGRPRTENAGSRIRRVLYTSL